MLSQYLGSKSLDGYPVNSHGHVDKDAIMLFDLMHERRMTALTILSDFEERQKLLDCEVMVNVPDELLYQLRSNVATFCKSCYIPADAIGTVVKIAVEYFVSQLRPINVDAVEIASVFMVESVSGKFNEFCMTLAECEIVYYKALRIKFDRAMFDLKGNEKVSYRRKFERDAKNLIIAKETVLNEAHTVLWKDYVSACKNRNIELDSLRSQCKQLIAERDEICQLKNEQIKLLREEIANKPVLLWHEYKTKN